ncbi:hypothetical protein [Bacteroides zoogleoformans]|uniref:hypothetical protein n=1 Tax=Bacteroides zoogleoformans TaxID=28119 RepID=UPI00248E5D57|nr:hypothetical protein [Bacteroides zoogleoformans]
MHPDFHISPFAPQSSATKKLSGGRIFFAFTNRLKDILNECRAFLINSTTNHADLKIPLDASEEHMTGKEDTMQFINEVKVGVKQWKPIVIGLGMAKQELRDV